MDAPRAVIALCALASVWACGPRPATRTEETREAAYRANNRGVALMDQFDHESAVAAFREALELDPSLRLAQLNLPIALFYAGSYADAEAAAKAASAAFPDTPQPPFILGLVARLENRESEAIAAFERVITIDPADPGAKVNLAVSYVQQRRYKEAVALCESALEIEPYNATAAYNLSLALSRTGDGPAGARAMQRFVDMRNTAYAVTYSQTYLEQGRYAEAVASTGTEADLVSRETPAARFADATTSLVDGASPAREAAPEPLSGGVTLADLDRDGDLDVIVTGTSLRVLRNDRPRLVDQTGALGLAAPVGGWTTGSVVADFNNDSRQDVLLLSTNGPRLLAQAEGGGFREVAIRSAGAASLPRVARAAAFADVDHDGDLDILLGGLTDPPARDVSGWSFLRSARPSVSRLLRNNGNDTFADITTAAGLDGVSAVVSVAPTDFDNRRDVDLLMVSYGARPRLFRNLRKGDFEDIAAAAGLPDAGLYTAVAIGDVNKDGFTDAFFGLESSPGLWALSDGRGRFRVETTPPTSRGTIAAQIFDYDNDGLLDLFVVSEGGPRVFRNLGQSWQDETSRAMPADVQEGERAGGGAVAITAGDLDLDGDTDVVALLRSGASRIWRNDGGNQQGFLRVGLTARVSNRNGVGTKIEVRAGSLHQKVETAAAVPATTPADVVFGLGHRRSADAVRVLWPAGIVQAETNLSAASAGSGILAIVELDRKPSSCPYLFAWNGTRFEFVTDFLGGGEMGSWLAPDTRNVPNPVEYVRIADHQLRARHGRFDIRVTNELEEALFLDHLELLAVTHPSTVGVFPDEGLRAAARPFRLFTTRNPRPPAAAVDEHGHDLLPLIARVDRQYPDDFALSSVRGYAGEHAITLDLPVSMSSDRTVLMLTGWTDYAFSSDNVAASQAGWTPVPPILQAKDAEGRWQTVDADVGFPVGRPQTLVVDVSRFRARQLRLVTTMRVYWDQILVADASAIPVKTETVPLQSARLRWRGFSSEATPDGKEPFGYDYDRVRLQAPWKLMPGRYTREGDVGPLVASADDHFVVSRSGDEIEVSFDASALPALPDGAQRTFLLRSVGYSKEMNLHSASPDHVAPIPFRAMSRYPYPPNERYPHADDLDEIHTRVVSRSMPLLDASLLKPLEIAGASNTARQRR